MRPADGRWRLVGTAWSVDPPQPSGLPTVSPAGNATFVHERSWLSRAGIAGALLHVKALVARGVAQTGTGQRPRRFRRVFIADVMGIGTGRVAFEVQKSRQVLREYERRRRRHAAAGMPRRCAGRQVPPGTGPAPPLFTVTDWLADPRVIVTGRTIAVNHGGAVAGRLVPVARCGASTGAAVETMRLLCPMCGDLREVVRPDGCAGPVRADYR